MMRKLGLIVALLMLPNCSARTVYLRTDGQDIANNSTLRQQLELDRLNCQVEPGDDQTCMAIKGYVAVPKDQAAAKQQQLSAIAAQNAQHDDTTSVLPPPVPPADKTAAAKKRKPKPPDNTLRSSQYRAYNQTLRDLPLGSVASAVSGRSLRAKTRPLS